MSTFALRQQALLTRLTAVTKFGNTATFTHTPKTYDNTTGKTTAGTPVVLITTVGGPTGVNPRFVNGSTVKESDQMIVVEASRLTFTLSLDLTRVEVDGKTFTITSIRPLRANDTDIGFRLVIR